jgi:mono/diheme cytochrome c family protein
MKLGVWGVGIAACLGIAAGMMPGKPKGELTVSFYLSTECPIAARQTPRIAAMAQEFASKGVAFTAYFPNEGESTAKINRYAKERKLDFPVALDLGGQRAATDHVEITPSVVVKDADGKVVYQGAIADNQVDDLVKKPYLHDALVAGTEGRKPAVAKSEPYGCFLMPGPRPPSVKEVTYAEHVAKIVNEHCVQCHRPGETAPFSLEGYDNARKWARMIALVTGKRSMPPWGAVEGIGDFHGENRLTDTELATLAAWSEAGAPRGDAKKEPTPPTFKPGWELGEPDMIVQMPEPFKVSAEGKDEYWNFVIDPKLDKEVYVRAMDVKPGNRKIVHHVIAFIDEKGRAEKMVQGPKGDKKNAYLTFGGVGFSPDGSVGGWAPGVRAKALPEGVAFVLKPGCKIVLQVHYHKSGKEEVDQTRMGLYLDEKPPTHPVDIGWLANPFIKIPAGKKDASFKQEIPIPVDIRLYSLMPHMHLLGREMKATLINPDGTEEPMIYVDKWDFNWQLVYMLKEPKLIKAGSKIRVETVYDNSAENPNNPSDPPKQVTWGEETTDEMMLLVAVYSTKP